MIVGTDRRLPDRRPDRYGAIMTLPRCLLPAMLLLSACGGEAADPPMPAEPMAIGAAAATPTLQGTDVTAQIDPDPVPATAAEIVSRESIQVQGEPACLFTLRYPGQIDQEVTWNGENCEAVTGAIVKPIQLAEAGQLADLPQEARLDIERMSNGVFVAESNFTAAAYPLNVAGRIYKVPYAD